MAKQKKKRNKPYRGADAAVDQPVITRIQAVKRNVVHQWWFDHKRVAKPLLIGGGTAAFILWIIVEGFRLLGR